MMPSPVDNPHEIFHYRQHVLAGLGLLLVVLFALLLSSGPATLLQSTVLLGVPAMVVSYLLSGCDRGQRYIQMGLSMFIAGGIGLLAGCAIEFGPLGLYGFLSLCRSIPLAVSPAILELFWQKLQLSPWTFLGMILGGNLGMLLFGSALRADAQPSRWQVLGVCNAGMLAGMLLGELLMNPLLAIAQPLIAVTLMVLTMLACMTLGMLLALALLDRVGTSPKAAAR